MKTRNLFSSLTMALLLVAPAAFVQELEPVVPDDLIVSPFVVTGQLEAVQLPSSPTFRIVGTYADPAEDIWFYRTILKRALLPDGNYADTRDDFVSHAEWLLPFDDEEWSEWQTWDLGNDEIEVPYADLPQYEPDPYNPGQQRPVYYLFSTQIMASDGTVSIGRQYGRDVANFRITTALAPTLTVFHPLLGEFRGAGANLQTAIDVLPGVEGEFTWEANAYDYGGEIASYRWGWDVLDIDDPDDPGWALPPGLSDAHRRAGPIPFQSGIHTLVIKVLDNYDQLTLRTFIITIVPVPDPASQLPLLLVDDTNDRNSNAWPGQSGEPLDRDMYRDAFWAEVLDGAGGVAGFDPDRDVIDTEVQQIEIRDIVNYRAVVWNSRWVSMPNSAIAGTFRPFFNFGSGDIPTYNWLGSYQEQVGNVLLCGNRMANNFLGEAPYVLPVVFESDEGSYRAGMTWINGVDVRVGFGHDEHGDPVYPDLHPYRNLGLAAFDIVSPNAAYYTPRGYLVRNERRNACVGVKGVTLDEDYVQNHMGGVPAFAEAIWSEETIDWRDDPFPTGQDVLEFTYIWSNDEFYDVDVQDRDTPFTIQDCEGQACVEPLLRMVSRFDWVKQERLAVDPDDTWPTGYYGGPGQPSLDTVCGDEALTFDNSTARTNAQVTAFVTHKYEDQKPSQVGDVVMGFDPYRFDHGPMKDALRWVLGEHFGLAMNP